ncbi:MAG: hypothetical protein OZSIB_3611 [Candidatus Ozemobacter sibiricus]|jgi:hypothetical protein|uniref:Uncharacterized protein n=1 Tax=Candidatus Ozemobacter sibiricus TaxID=2268124 RepID=A0A367ZQJ0_9BACT|nr:MAG: hypothetical protein OZSIB_3611 [Candidatus Ozemobacter sibiricus]
MTHIRTSLAIILMVAVAASFGAAAEPLPGGPSGHPVRALPGIPPVATVPLASEALYDLALVNMYAEFDPAAYEAAIIADAWLVTTASDPVVMRCHGNFKQMTITSSQRDLAFRYVPPYFWFYNIEPGETRITFTYRVRHDGFSTPGAVIAPNRLALDRLAFWYPRNIASDPHQVILNLVTDPGYPVYANASLTRDIPNNRRRLRTFVLRTPSAGGLELRSTP